MWKYEFAVLIKNLTCPPNPTNRERRRREFKIYYYDEKDNVALEDVMEYTFCPRFGGEENSPSTRTFKEILKEAFERGIFPNWYDGIVLKPTQPFPFARVDWIIILPSMQAAAIVYTPVVHLYAYGRWTEFNMDDENWPKTPGELKKLLARMV
jgi:hypothetical protein